MIQANITSDYPVMKAYIRHNTPRIKGVIHTEPPLITAQIKKAINHDPEPYYEVANEYGITIIIGD